jgi:GGDEF domain-containing protein
MHYFRSQALEKMHDKNIDISSLIFLFLDIENFKILNEKYGFWEGNAFLKKFADMTEQVFKDSLVAHFSNDNFVVLTRNEAVEEKLHTIRRNLLGMNYDIKLGLKVGGYKPEDRECLPLMACDRARYACYTIKKHYNHDYCEYDNSMASSFQKKQYIINNIDEAIKKEYIKIYYQPVVNAKNGKLCGLEALARWDDPKYGFLSPADFIQTLEEYYQIYKLDMFVVEKVCQHFVHIIELNLPLIPVSLNFSRRDFDSINLADDVEACLKKYGVDKKLIHIEVTESTLSENDEKLSVKTDAENECEIKIDTNSSVQIAMKEVSASENNSKETSEFDFSGGEEKSKKQFALDKDGKITVEDLRTKAAEETEPAESKKSAIKTSDIKLTNDSTAVMSLELNPNAEADVLSLNTQTAASNGSNFQTMLSNQLTNVAPEFVKAGNLVLKDNNQGTINLILHPDDLGNVKIHLSLDGKTLIGHITVATKEDLQVFKDNAETLREAFIKSGFDAASFDVAMNNGGSFNQSMGFEGQDETRNMFAKRAYGDSAGGLSAELDDIFENTVDISNYSVNIVA